MSSVLPCRQGDLSLPAAHPKKVFIARVLDLEVRLSYHERIKSTLPTEYIEASNGVFQEIGPEPNFTYEVEGPSSYANAAADILKLMRSKAMVSEVNELLETMKRDFIAGEIGDEPIDEEGAETRARDIVYQCILVIGSRSFSHFLNALERYITLLRELTNSSASRLALLRSASRFWTSNSLFRHIVFDKLLQYRIVDPIDVVKFVFEGEESQLDEGISPRDWTEIRTWDLLRMTMEKVQNRVLAVNLRLETIKKREENRMDTERAAATEMKTDENEDASKQDDTSKATDTDALALQEVANVEKQVQAVGREQQSLFTDIVSKWQAALSSLSSSDDPWQPWFAKGWFSEFCRAVGREQLRYFFAVHY